MALCIYTMLEKIPTCKPLINPKESWKTTSLTWWKERMPKTQPRQRPSSIRLLVVRPYLLKTKVGIRGKHFIHLASFHIFLFILSMSFSLDACFGLVPFRETFSHQLKQRFGFLLIAVPPLSNTILRSLIRLWTSKPSLGLNFAE